MRKSIETLRSYLATATARGTWEKVLALLAMLCGTLFSYAFTLAGRSEGGNDALLAVWALPVLMPLATYIWAKWRPARSPARDPRLWLLAATGALACALGVLREGGQDPTEFAEAVLMLLVTFGLALAAILWKKRRGEAAAAWAESHGWSLDKKRERDLAWEDSWIAEMTRREKLVNAFVFGSSFLLFFVGSGVLLVASGGFDEGMSKAFGVVLGCFEFSYGTLLCYSFFLIRRQYVQKKRGVAELDAARQMQMSLMPVKAPDIAGLDIAGVTIPTTEVGGDLFHYYAPPGIPGGVGIAVADVSGKGMKAAIATVLVSGMLRAERERGDSPAELLSAVNRGLLGGTGVAGFVAMQVLVVDGRTREARYSNAGQVHPLLFRKGEVRSVSLGGLPLGIDGEAVYEEVRLTLEGGDVLLLLSDGIIETMNEKREMFGFEGAEAMTRQLDLSKAAAEMRETLIGEVRAFQGKAQQQDDMTLVVVRVL